MRSTSARRTSRTGDFNCLRLPDDAREKENDYVMLPDIFPTGWHCTRRADMRPGDSMVVYGAGPVGLMAAYSAMIQGASQVMIVDRPADRLKLAEQAPEAYEHFDNRDDGWTKVLLKPTMAV